MPTMSIAVRRLPTCPGVARMVLELCRQGASDLGLVADVLMADPGIALRILRFANAPGLSRGGSVTSVRDAVLALGLRASKMAALGFSLPDELLQNCPAFDLRRFWSENLLRAAVARHIVAPSLRVNRETSFTAVLLANIGKLVLACAAPAEYSAMVSRAESDAALTDIERQTFGKDHAAAGSELLSNWGLPKTLFEAILAGAGEQVPVDNPLGRVVFESRRLVEAASGDQDSSTSELEQLCERLGISRAIWDSALLAIEQDYHTTIELFEEQILPADAATLLADAQLETARMAASPREAPPESSRFQSTSD